MTAFAPAFRGAWASGAFIAWDPTGTLLAVEETVRVASGLFSIADGTAGRADAADAEEEEEEDGLEGGRLGDEDLTADPAGDALCVAVAVVSTRRDEARESLGGPCTLPGLGLAGTAEGRVTCVGAGSRLTIAFALGAGIDDTGALRTGAATDLVVPMLAAALAVDVLADKPTRAGTKGFLFTGACFGADGAGRGADAAAASGIDF